MKRAKLPPLVRELVRDDDPPCLRRALEEFGEYAKQPPLFEADPDEIGEIVFGERWPVIVAAFGKGTGRLLLWRFARNALEDSRRLEAYRARARKYAFVRRARMKEAADGAGN